MSDSAGSTGRPLRRRPGAGTAACQPEWRRPASELTRTHWQCSARRGGRRRVINLEAFLCRIRPNHHYVRVKFSSTARESGDPGSGRPLLPAGSVSSKLKVASQGDEPGYCRGPAARRGLQCQSQYPGGLGTGRVRPRLSFGVTVLVTWPTAVTVPHATARRRC